MYFYKLKDNLKMKKILFQIMENIKYFDQDLNSKGFKT